jgi:hypothetical protein
MIYDDHATPRIHPSTIERPEIGVRSTQMRRLMQIIALPSRASSRFSKWSTMSRAITFSRLSAPTIAPSCPFALKPLLSHDLSVASLKSRSILGRLLSLSARLGTHSNPCDHYGCEGETREIVLRIAVISGCDASPVLELAEHSFDEISAFVGPAVQRIGRPA